MYNEQTLSTMQSMKLCGMAKGFEERLGSPQHSELSHAEFVGLLVQDEKTYRENLRLKRLIQNAKFKQQAALEGIDYKHSRGLSKQAIAEVSNPQWIAAHRNILITGPTGVGKTYLACAFGNLAARAGFTALYVRAPRMFEILASPPQKKRPFKQPLERSWTALSLPVTISTQPHFGGGKWELSQAKQQENLELVPAR